MKFLTMAIIIATAALAACSPDTQTGLREQQNEQIDREARSDAQNAANKATLGALLAEIEPHVRYDERGGWSLAEGTTLSSSAREFASRASAAYAASLSVDASPTVAQGVMLSSIVGANQRGLTRFWWGYRIAIPTGVASGVSDTYRRSGAVAAVRLLVGYYGSTSWVAGIAAYFVPAYAITIGVVDRLGGKRGVFANVPWTIVPTVITAQ